MMVVGCDDFEICLELELTSVKGSPKRLQRSPNQ